MNNIEVPFFVKYALFAFVLYLIGFLSIFIPLYYEKIDYIVFSFVFFTIFGIWIFLLII